MGKFTLAPLTNWHLYFHAHSTEVSGFFEPSIQSTVDSIRDNFSKRLATGSVRTSGAR